MIPRFFSSADELHAIFEALKHTPCPHCKTIGALIRHGYLRGYDEDDPRRKSVRARRLFCNNRKTRNNGCGRTFSVWAAEKIRRLSLHTGSLWKFLQGVAAGQSMLQAFRGLPRMLTDRAAYPLTIGIDNVNRVLIQPHWQKDVDIKDF